MCDYLDFLEEIKGTEKEEDFNIADEKSQCLLETVADYNSMIDEYGDVKLSELRDKAMKELEKIWEKYPVLKPIPEKPQLD